MNSPVQSSRIASLNFLRFVGIMLIVLHHLPAVIVWQPKGLGDLGTAFFFAFSGFVLPLGYTKMNNVRDSLRFLWNRMVRIHPLHVVTFLAVLCVFFGGELLSRFPRHC